MATAKAFAAVCSAIKQVLENAAKSELAWLGLSELAIRIYRADSFTPDDNNDDSIVSTKNGVSIYLYRVLPDLTHRTPSGRLLPDGNRKRTRLPVDLYVLLTAWGSTAANQHMIAGWMMRTLEDYPTFPVPVLNSPGYDNTFNPNEGVELALHEMPNEELMQLWEQLTERPYQLSVPYIVRGIYIDSQRELAAGVPIQIRQLNMAVLEDDV